VVLIVVVGVLIVGSLLLFRQSRLARALPPEGQADVKKQYSDENGGG
jgi:hypothetical protein